MYDVIGYLPNSSNMEIFDVDFETPRRFLKIFIWNFSSLFFVRSVVSSMLPLMLLTMPRMRIIIWVSIKRVRCVNIFLIRG